MNVHGTPMKVRKQLLRSLFSASTLFRNGLFASAFLNAGIKLWVTTSGWVVLLSSGFSYLFWVVECMLVTQYLVTSLRPARVKFFVFLKKSENNKNTLFLFSFIKMYHFLSNVLKFQVFLFFCVFFFPYLIFPLVFWVRVLLL